MSEKYGVETEAPSDKTAAEGKTCPRCGLPVEPTDIVGVWKCPTHGTAPFERPTK